MNLTLRFEQGESAFNPAVTPGQDCWFGLPSLGPSGTRNAAQTTYPGASYMPDLGPAVGGVQPVRFNASWTWLDMKLAFSNFIATGDYFTSTLLYVPNDCGAWSTSYSNARCVWDASGFGGVVFGKDVDNKYYVGSWVYNGAAAAGSPPPSNAGYQGIRQEVQPDTWVLVSTRQTATELKQKINQGSWLSVASTGPSNITGKLALATGGYGGSKKSVLGMWMGLSSLAPNAEIEADKIYGYCKQKWTGANLP